MSVIDRKKIEYIYSGDKVKGVIIDIDTFNRMMELLEDVEDIQDFKKLREEEAIPYDEYRKKSNNHFSSKT